MHPHPADGSWRRYLHMLARHVLEDAKGLSAGPAQDQGLHSPGGLSMMLRASSGSASKRVHGGIFFLRRSLT